MFGQIISNKSRQSNFLRILDFRLVAHSFYKEKLNKQTKKSVWRKEKIPTINA